MQWCDSNVRSKTEYSQFSPAHETKHTNCDTIKELKSKEEKQASTKNPI